MTSPYASEKFSSGTINLNQANCLIKDQYPSDKRDNSLFLIYSITNDNSEYEYQGTASGNLIPYCTTYEHCWNIFYTSVYFA